MAWPNITDGAVIQIVIPADHDFQAVFLMLHYIYRANGGGADPISDVAAAMDTQFQSAADMLDVYSAALSVDVGIRPQYWFQVIYPTRYARISLPNGHGSSGPAGSLPPANAICITKRSTGATRHSHGTSHIGGVPAGYVTDGVLNGTEGSVYTDLAARIAAPFTLGLGPQSVDPVILNRASPGLSEVINGTAVQTTARTMRRRVVGRGI